MYRLTGPLLVWLAATATAPRQKRFLKRCEESESCVNINNCMNWCEMVEAMGASGLSLAQRRQFNHNKCGFDGLEPRLCCHKKNISQFDVCNLKVKSTPTCGKILNDDSRIALGEAVPNPGAWPWMARLIYKENLLQFNRGVTYCGGTLVSVRHVVTAAHCCRQDATLGSPLAVVLGELDIGTEYDCVRSQDGCGADGEQGRQCLRQHRCKDKAEEYQVQSVITHEKYSTSGKLGTAIYDIAVLVVDRPVRLTTSIQPICLPAPARPPSFDSPHQALVLTGWGLLGNDGFKPSEFPQVLQQLRGLKERPLNDTEDAEGCRSLLRQVADLEDHHICVGKDDSNANGCNGDSGGPLSRLYRSEAKDEGFWELAGVVSFGVTTNCGSKTPLVLTRVGEPAILDWVRDKVGTSLPSTPEGA